jgi:rod shape-determining protein MreB
VFDLGERLPPPRRRSRLGRAWNALGRDVAVDLGTANTLVFVRGQGVVLDQPSFVAVDVEAGRVLALGAEAKEMLGRAPEPIQVIRPLRSGVISDFEAAQHLLREFLLRVHHRKRFVKPRVIVCVPSGVTQVERRAVEEAAFEAGARRVAIVSEPLAAAVGAGLPIEDARGSMVVDIGGGTTDVAVFVLGGTVASANIPVGGDALDQAVIAFCRKELGIGVGERTAERLKVVGGGAHAGARNILIEFLGRDMATGKPRTARVHSDALAEGLAEPVSNIVDTVISVFDRMPTEIVPDIAVRGITLTGGGSLLAGLATRMQREAGIKVTVDPEPLSCVVRGAGALLDRLPGGRRFRD